LRIYYAHPICFYGTEQEANVLNLIKKTFEESEIINPADYNKYADYEDVMEYYLELVRSCDIVVFSKLLGKVTAGVGKEVNFALDIGKKVFRITEEQIIPIHTSVEYLSRSETIELYSKWRSK
jgi:hypothetical protein